MEIVVKRRICDKCHKDIVNEKEFVPVCDVINCHNYDLCDDCFGVYREYEKAVNELWEKQDKITKDFGFGKYIPKYKDKNDNT